MIGWEGGREGWVDITTFNNLFTSFCFSLKRSSWDASFLAWKKEGKCFNNGNDDDDEEDDGNNDGGGGDRWHAGDSDENSDEDNDDGDEDEDDDNNRMHYRTKVLETAYDVCQIQRWRHGRVVFSDVVHPHLRARKHVLLIDVPLDNIIIKY